jgi:hypothetical protein
MIDLEGVNACWLAVAMHEAAHVVAHRHFGMVGSRVTMGPMEIGVEGRSFTVTTGETSAGEFLGSCLGALVLTDEIEELLPGALNPNGDWETASELMGLSPDEIRETPLWNGAKAWLNRHRLEIGDVAQQILAGREVFDFPDGGEEGAGSDDE